MVIPRLEETAVFIADKLKGKNYAIRGTASLVLQGLDMNVDDIDILGDKKTALACNRVLKRALNLGPTLVNLRSKACLLRSWGNGR